MENLTNIVDNKYIQALDNDLFGFLEDRDPKDNQLQFEVRDYGFGWVHIETLGSGALGKMNEDAPVVFSMGEGRTLLAVLDGASSQKPVSGFTSEGISGAYYLSHMVQKKFSMSQEYNNLCQKPELTAKDVMITMNGWIKDNIQNIPGVDYSDPASVPGMAAAFLLVDEKNNRLTLAQVADATIASVDLKGNIQVLTPNLNEKFDTETMKYVEKLVKEFDSDLSHIRQIPEAKELIRKQLVDSYNRKINKKGGCGILNGMPEMVSNGLVYTDSMPLDDKISSILLFSDGAILPYTGKEISMKKAVKSLVNVLDERNDTPVLNLGESILEDDSNFVKIPRMKLKDDATFIEIRFNKS